MITLIKSFSGTDLIVAGLAMLLTLIISLSLHEYAHAFVAYKNGDDTSKLMGRLTLNPLAHLDPMGLFFCIVFGFGWAKPVPVNTLKFRNYKKGIAWVSVAGVITNFILAFICYICYALCIKFILVSNVFVNFLEIFLFLMFNLNIMLFVFNLLPFYPLDGFNFINAFTKYDNKFIKFAKEKGPIFLIGLLIFDDILYYLTSFSIFSFIVNLVSLPITMIGGLIL